MRCLEPPGRLAGRIARWRGHRAQARQARHSLVAALNTPHDNDEDDSSILVWARKVQAIAQTGIAFTHDPYDRERYEQLQELVASLLAAELDIPLGRTRALWDQEDGYATPKVDVRGAAFDGDKVLLVRERADGKWTLPGGWVDVNDAPSEAVVREIYEESGFRAKALKLAALVDKNLHPSPPFRSPHLQAVLSL